MNEKTKINQAEVENLKRICKDGKDALKESHALGKTKIYQDGEKSAIQIVRGVHAGKAVAHVEFVKNSNEFTVYWNQGYAGQTLLTVEAQYRTPYAKKKSSRQIRTAFINFWEKQPPKNGKFVYDVNGKEINQQWVEKGAEWHENIMVKFKFPESWMKR